MRGWARDGERIRPRVGTPRRGRPVRGLSVYVSVGQRLIELEGTARSVVAQYSTGDRGVVVQEGPETLRNGEHPLAHGKRRQDMVDEMSGGLDHTAGITRRTCSTTSA